MSNLSDKLANLSPEMRKLLAAQLRGDATEVPPVAAAPPGQLRWSAQQEQMLFLEQTGGDPSEHNLMYRFTLHGRVDDDRLVTALRETVRRQSALSAPTGWNETDTRTDLPVRVVAATDSTPDDVLGELLRAEAADPLSLENRVLARATLVHFSQDEHLLLWTVHQAAWDTPSVAIFMRETEAAYEAATGVAGVVEDLKLTYSDFSHWQYEMLSRRGDDLRQWWSATDYRGVSLPLDHPRRDNDGRLRNVTPVQMSADVASSGVTSALAEIGRAVGAELPTVVFGLLTLLVSRWNYQDEVTMGWTGDTRPKEQFDDVIGSFSNVLPVTVGIDPAADLPTLLSTVSTGISQAVEHGDLPLAQIASAMNPGEPGRNTVINLKYGFENSEAAVPSIDLGGCRMALAEAYPGAMDVDVSFVVREREGGLELTTSYRDDLFDRASLENFVESLGELLRSATQDDGTPLGRLGIVTDRQRAALADLGNGGISTPAACDTVLEAVYKHAASRPDSEAVHYDGRSHTYAEILTDARAIADALGAHGVGPGARVLLLSRQSPVAVSTVLATSMLGAAYVPLDVEAPAARLSSIVGSTGAAALVIGADAHREQARELVGDTIPIIDPQAEQAEQAEIGVIDPRAEIRAPRAGMASATQTLPTPDDTAYVIFTSGSTGAPKGVVVSQRSLLHFCNEFVAAFAMQSDDRVLAFARPSFDVSVLEVLATLYAGGTICIAAVEQRRDPQLLADFMRHERVSVAELPPALMPRLEGDYPDLRIVSVGGEAFPGSLVEEWARDGQEFWNGYGPTETTVGVTLMRCEGQWLTSPPIGRPLPGLRAYVLDAHGQLLPPTAIGELCIAGPSLADGYLGEPELTARSFCFVPDIDERIYKTGDLVRWRPDRNLDFYGRNDRQVQVNGFRVELSEIEQILGTIDGIDQVRVEFLDHHALGQCLIAFIVPVAEEAVPDATALRQDAVKRLPDYAVPRRFVPLPAVPLTPNGKVDRSALEEVLASQDADVVGAAEPVLSSTERRLAEKLIGPALGIRTPDPDARFFELGGNSLQVTQIVGGILEEFGVRLPLVDFFKNSSIRALAVQVDRAADSTIASPDVDSSS
ncbi:amino acid adenylation domain-containing protein [Streptomyces sp. NPDC059002]|uniref:non-ribosomal peptide synthetase n=1 Tax=Streptomyces sp. NPDC059002 TaxID=3346690 RepID=UPI00368E82C6